ncbi:MAG: DNA repair protein RadC [Peptoniphilus harei]|uniref:RadC family protein n=1 Tax=Peptoniphilus harei TaxID=54005 RepID=UPI002900AFBC|nr:DNA repair protein RadC [Peptoniphilus harei]MDU2373235.1 DNA repair protein RadC [Peptoniphilus harei]
MKERDFEKYTIKEMPEDERPQEKLIKFGPDYLSNAELLALIIRTGNRKGDSAIDTATKVLRSLRTANDSNGLNSLKNANLSNLMEVDGIGEAKATMILAAVQLGIRLAVSSNGTKIRVTSPSIAANYVLSEMSVLEQEHFRIMTLNTKKEINFIREISKGTINMTIVHAREVFRAAISDNAHSIILLHNHPTGDPSPSKEDIGLTKNLIEASKIIGIDILDHIIIGDNRYFSFLEEGLL